MNKILAKAWNVVRHEPVAAWGLLASAVLNWAAWQFGLDAHWVDAVSTFLIVVGVPVVRSRVTPMAVLDDFTKNAVAQAAKDQKKA